MRRVVLGSALVVGAAVLAWRWPGVRSTLESAAADIRAFAAAVGEGMAEREAQLRTAIGSDVGVSHTPQQRRLLDDPSGL